MYDVIVMTRGIRTLFAKRKNGTLVKRDVAMTIGAKDASVNYCCCRFGDVIATERPSPVCRTQIAFRRADDK